ncbi:hypothetical protein Tco_1244508 [Tanacetum coccineum]
MLNPKFVETHNLVAFLEKPKESDRFKGIIDFLNASSIRYALTIQALVDKKVIITETSIRIDLKLEDAEGTDCLPTATIFAELERMGAKTTAWNEFSSTMASAIICLATNQKFNFSKYIFDNMVKNLEGGVKFLIYPRFVQVFLDNLVEGVTKHKGIYVTPSHTKKVFANMKRPGKGFSGKVTPLFQTMMVQAPEDMGEDSVAPTDSYSTPIITQPSSSKPQKKQSRRKQGKDNGPTEPIPNEATNAEHVSTSSYDPPQSGEDRLQLTKVMSLCTSLQDKVRDLEKEKTTQAKEIASLKNRVKQLEKRVDVKKLQGLKEEDASKQGRKIADLDADAEVTLIDETQEINDEEMLFDVQDDLQGEEVVAEKKLLKRNAPTITIDESTLAQTLIEIKAAKLKAVTTTATTTTTTRPKARGVVVQELSEFKTTSSPSQASQLPQAKDKGKAIMVEPEKPLKKKDQIALDEEVARNLKERLQTREQEELTDKEKARLFVDLLEKRKKHFAALRAKEKRNKPPTKAQKKKMTRVNMFVDMDTEMKEGSNKAKTDTAQESSSKRAGDELEQEKAKKKTGDDDQEEEEMKKHMEIVQDDEGDLKVMFELDVESEVWRNLQGYNVTVWKLFSSSGVHFVRFQNMHIFMLVEKKYPLTPATITKMINKKLQTNQWNEMCYQLLKLMTKQCNNPGSGRIVGIKRLQDILRVTAAQLQLLSDYYCWKDYADRDEIKDLSEKR